MDHREMKIEYVRYYSPGSEALKLEPQKSIQPKTQRPAPKKGHRPVQQPTKVLELHVDPLALLAICMTVIMVVLMAVGLGRLKAAQQELRDTDAYVAYLEDENRRLSEQLEDGYDLEALKKAAVSLGLVPIGEVAHIGVEMDTPGE